MLFPNSHSSWWAFPGSRIGKNLCGIALQHKALAKMNLYNEFLLSKQKYYDNFGINWTKMGMLTL